MLSGHAFSCALHAHILTSAAFICVLIKKICRHWPNQTGLPWEPVQSHILNQEQNVADVTEEECIKQLSQMISQHLDQAASQSRTGKLWVQYIRQVALLQHFIHAERTGNWRLHLYSEREMIPHFYAACMASSLSKVYLAASTTDGSLTANHASRWVHTIYR